MQRRLPEATALAGGARKDVLAAVEAALEASDPSALVRRALKLRGRRLSVDGRSLNLGGFRRVVVVGGGKASGLMAVEVERVLGPRIDEGLVIVPDYQKSLPRLRKVKFAGSTHPLPSEKGARAVRRMLRLVDRVGPGDLAVMLLSGGGSAMMPAPPPGVTVEDIAGTTDLLLKAGADIRETNCVRKHLSQIAGGRLAERTNGAEVVVLAISDVVGDDLSYIASGPAVPDPSTFSQARSVLMGRKIWTRVPSSVRRTIEAGAAGSIGETPKPGSHVFDRVTSVVIGSNAGACAAAKASLESHGYEVRVRTGVTGEARKVGQDLAALVVSERKRRWAAIWGGEMTVTVTGDGKGGRNQEAALAAAIELEGSLGVVSAFFGTDGVDGPTDAAGAVVDGTTVERGIGRRLDAREFLRRNDSHGFFRRLGDLLVTGPTGTNVNDVMIAVRG